MNPLPSSLTVTVTTPAGGTLRSSETAAMAFTPDGTPGDVAVERNIYDPYEDETPPGYRPPADPRRWKAAPEATATPAIRDAVSGVQAVLEAVDWSKVEKSAPTATDSEYVRIDLRFAERPAGMDHLDPMYLSSTDSWHVGVRTSLDLFTSRELAPLLDATRGAVSLAARVATPVDPA